MPTSFYGEDLAFIHEVGFTSFITDSIPALQEFLEENDIVDGCVVDLGCGSGVWLARLSSLGYSAVGIDVSAPLLRIARERAPGARLIEGSFFDVELPRCRAMTAIGECFNYLDSTSPLESLHTLLKRVHRALEVGGILIFDMAVPGRIGPNRQNNFVLEDDWAVLVDAEEVEDSQELERRITTFRRVGDLFRRGFEKHRLRLVSAERILQMTRAAGFDARQLDAYGEREFPPGYTAFLAKKV